MHPPAHLTRFAAAVPSLPDPDAVHLTGSDVADLRAALASLTPRQLARVLTSAGVAPVSDDMDALVEAGVLGVTELAVADDGEVEAGDAARVHRSIIVGAKYHQSVTAIKTTTTRTNSMVSLTARAGPPMPTSVPTCADADAVVDDVDGASPSSSALPTTPQTPGSAFARDAVVALNSDDTATSAMAAWAVMRWLTLRPAEWTHLTGARAVEPLVDLLLCADARACACGALALRAFVAGGGSGAQAEAARAGAVGAAVAALVAVHDDAAWTATAVDVGAAAADAAAAATAQQEAVAALLGGLTRHNTALKLAAVSAGAVPALARLLHSPSPQLAAAAATSLQPLTSLPAARDALRACPGAIAALARLLTTSHVDGSQRAAASALQNVALDATASNDLLSADVVTAFTRALAAGVDGPARAAVAGTLANVLRLDDALRDAQDEVEAVWSRAAQRAASDPRCAGAGLSLAATRPPPDRSAPPPFLEALVSCGGLDILLALLAGRGAGAPPPAAAARDAAAPLLVVAASRSGRAALLAADGASAVVDSIARRGAALPSLDIAAALARDSASACVALTGAGGLAAALDAVRRDPDARNRALSLLHSLASHDPHAPAALGAADALHTLGVLVAAAADDVDERLSVAGGASADVPPPILRLLTRAAKLLVMLASHPDNAISLAQLAPDLRRLARRLVASPIDAVAAAGLDIHGVAA